MNQCGPSCRLKGTKHIHESRAESWRAKGIRKADDVLLPSSKIRERHLRNREVLEALRQKPTVTTRVLSELESKQRGFQSRVDAGEEGASLAEALELFGMQLSYLQQEAFQDNTAIENPTEIAMSKTRVPSASESGSSSEDESLSPKTKKAIADTLYELMNQVGKSLSNPVEGISLRNDIEAGLDELQRSAFQVPQEYVLHLMEQVRKYIALAMKSRKNSVDWSAPMSDRQRQKILKGLRTKTVNNGWDLALLAKYGYKKPDLDGQPKTLKTYENPEPQGGPAQIPPELRKRIRKAGRLN